MGDFGKDRGIGVGGEHDAASQGSDCSAVQGDHPLAMSRLGRTQGDVTGVHTATDGRIPVRCHSLIRSVVPTTALGRRAGGNSARETA